MAPTAAARRIAGAPRRSTPQTRVTSVEGNSSAGDKLPDNYLSINTRSDRLRSNLRADFRKLVQQAVLATSTADHRVFLPLERANNYHVRLIPIYGAVSDSTTVILNGMEIGARYTIKVRNEREYPVHILWQATLGRRLYWDALRPVPEILERGGTLIVDIFVDDTNRAFAAVHGLFREDPTD